MEGLFIIGFLLWYVLSLIISERYGKKSRLGVEGTMLVSMLFSPLVGFIAVKFYS